MSQPDFSLLVACWEVDHMLLFARYIISFALFCAQERNRSIQAYIVFQQQSQEKKCNVIKIV